ncbi:MAG: hypothetical protein ABL933_06660 [Methyloglobulus sp.]|nr:hypothetical protein [Methyloglobulus sp.]
MIAFVLAGILLAFLAGILAAFGQLLFLALLLGAIGGVVLIAKPRLAVWVVLIGGFVVTGLAELYLPQLQQVRWGVALLSIALIPLAIIIAGFKADIADEKKLDSSASSVLFWAIGIVFCALLATIANSSAMSTGLVGLKNYFQMFGLLATFAALRYTPKEADRFMRFLLLLGLVQLPFVLHQFLVLVPLRSTEEASADFIVAVDIVAGTFGGSLMGGGRSSTLALLASITITLVFAQWRTGQKSLLKASLFSFIFMLPMALNEAKLFIVMLPIALCLLFKDSILQNPFKSVMTGFVVVGFLASLLVVTSMLPGAKSQQSLTLDSFIESSLAYNIGNVGYGSDILNRTTVYPFWWTENISHGDYVKALFGHGLGATNSASAAATHTLANTRYNGYGIDLTAISCLLWEIGILGTVTVLAFFLQAYLLGGKLANRWVNTQHWPFIKTAQISITLVAISLLHNNYFVVDISFQTIYLLLVGYLVAMSRNTLEKP